MGGVHCAFKPTKQKKSKIMENCSKYPVIPITSTAGSAIRLSLYNAFRLLLHQLLTVIVYLSLNDLGSK